MPRIFCKNRNGARYLPISIFKRDVTHFKMGRHLKVIGKQGPLQASSRLKTGQNNMPLNGICRKFGTLLQAFCLKIKSVLQFGFSVIIIEWGGLLHTYSVSNLSHHYLDPWTCRRYQIKEKLLTGSRKYFPRQVGKHVILIKPTFLFLSIFCALGYSRKRGKRLAMPLKSNVDIALFFLKLKMKQIRAREK